jgi:Na+/H+ antiporter NhaD/arsenite permease-like protein
MFDQVEAEVSASLAQVSDLIFFLLGAMTVVEVVDTHGGFAKLAAAVRTDSRRSLAWTVAFSSFCMSAVLDNLTTTIVILSLLQVGSLRDQSVMVANVCFTWLSDLPD